MGQAVFNEYGFYVIISVMGSQEKQVAYLLQVTTVWLCIFLISISAF